MLPKRLPKQKKQLLKIKQKLWHLLQKDDKVSEKGRKCDDTSSSVTTEAAVVEKPALEYEEVAKLAAEASKKGWKVAETATTEKTEAADKESNTNCPSNRQKADKAVDEKADKKDEKKAENPITATKNCPEQLSIWSRSIEHNRLNFADKKAEDKAGKEAIANRSSFS